MKISSQLLKPDRSAEDADAPEWRAGLGGPDLDPLPRLLGYALRRTHIAVFKRFRSVFAEFEIRPAQLGVLTVVHNNPGLKQSDVSAALGIKRTNFGPLLDGLITRGFVVRRKVAEDRRVSGLHLTPEGQVFVKQLHEREAAFEREIAALIGEDGRRDLLSLLDRVALTCRDETEAS
jgi:DNA-binding MarR family transcriptional regulator